MQVEFGYPSTLTLIGSRYQNATTDRQSSKRREEEEVIAHYRMIKTGMTKQTSVYTYSTRDEKKKETLLTAQTHPNSVTVNIHPSTHQSASQQLSSPAVASDTADAEDPQHL